MPDRNIAAKHFSDTNDEHEEKRMLQRCFRFYFLFFFSRFPFFNWFTRAVARVRIGRSKNTTQKLEAKSFTKAWKPLGDRLCGAIIEHIEQKILIVAVVFVGHRCHKLFREGSCKSPYQKSAPIHPSDLTINYFYCICLKYLNQLVITE